MTETKYTFCRICEAACGLAVEVDNNRIIAIEPDRKHVVTKGFVCVKGTRFAAVQNSPDRITSPQKRVGDKWLEISWQQAMSEIGDKIKSLQQKHSKQAVGHFVGSPAGANVMSPLFRNALFKALGSDRLYGTPSTDTINKFRVNEDMYGSSFHLTFPDIKHVKFLLVIGANPGISGNSLYHLPRAGEQMRDIVKKGGRVVFLNPRRVETAARAGEHVFIRPDTDVYFLAAFCNELIQQQGVDLERVEKYMEGFDTLKSLVADWNAEKQQAVTGVGAEVFRGLVSDHINSGGAALYMSTGVNQGRSGTLCYWLLESINAISGNLDKVGGTQIGKGLFDLPKEISEKGEFVKKLRPDGYPIIIDNHPSGLLADDILNDKPDRLRALIIEAGNPLIACGNPNGRLEKALSELELIVAVDLFRNETGNLAHYILPAPTTFERADIPYALQSFTGNTPVRYMTYTDPVLEAPENVRHEWWIFSKLAEVTGVTMFENKFIAAALKINTRLAYSKHRWLRRLAVTPETLLDGMLKKYKAGSRKDYLSKYPHGRLLGDDSQANTFLGKRVLTENGKVNLAPKDFVATFQEQMEPFYQQEIAQRQSFKLIAKRELHTMNSWLGNSEALIKPDTNYLYIHPDDASKLNLQDDDIAEVTSQFASVEIPVRVNDMMMPRTVAIPHGWGHAKADGLKYAQSKPGVNSNLLAGDGPENTEKLSGMSVLSGIVVSLSKKQCDSTD